MFKQGFGTRFSKNSLIGGVFVAGLFLSAVHSRQNISEKKIVIVIPSYNNKDWYEKNLDSVFSQQYSNYRVIYIDDCSPDGTGDLVEQYLKERDLEDKCQLVKNTVRYGQLFNRYKAIHGCDDNEIIVLLDGDDWLSHDEVLSYLNHIYSTEGILLSVGNACKSSTGQKIGYRDYTKEELQNYGFRQLGFRGVHPRTFYAGLFKEIKAQDLMHGGKFLMMATDVAFMLPLFEMAFDRYKYVHDILYVYNTDNAINLFKSKFEFQIYYDLITRNRKPYPVYTQNFGDNVQETSFVNLSYVIFMEEEREMTRFFRQRERENVFFDSIVKVGNLSTYKNSGIRQFCSHFSTLDVGYSLDQVYNHRFNFKEKLLKALQKCKGEYVLLSTQDLLSFEHINLSECLKKLEATGADGIFFGTGKTSVLQERAYDVSPWKAPYSSYLFNKWMYHDIFENITDCCGVLIRKSECINLVEHLEIFHPNFHTFLAAANSVLREDGLYLMVPSLDGDLHES